MARYAAVVATLVTLGACGGEAPTSIPTGGSGTGGTSAMPGGTGGAAGSGGASANGGAAGTSTTGGTGGAAAPMAGSAGAMSASGGAGAGAGAAAGTAGANAGSGGASAGAGGADAGQTGTGGADAGRAGASGGAGTPALSFEADIWPVFDKIRDPVFVYYGGSTYESCTTSGVCHGGEDPGAGLSMKDASTAYDQLLGIASTSSLCDGSVRVIAGQPEESCLIQFYEGRLRDELDWVDTAEIDLAREWIAQGARP